jgi:DNA modification methylase
MTEASSPSSELPLAIWPCAQHDSSDRRDERRRDLARRTIEVYSDPGDLVVDPACGSGTAIVEAIRLDRDAIGIEADRGRAGLARANLRHVCHRSAAGRAEVVVGTPSELPRLLAAEGARVLCRHSRSNVAQLAYGSVDLVLTSTTEPRRMRRAQLVELCRESARVVKPGGFVVIVTRDQPGRPNRAAETVSIAEEVGLHFWQHAVALLAPVRDGELAVDARWRATAGLHRICHEDVLVFRRPAVAAVASTPVEARCAEAAR